MKPSALRLLALSFLCGSRAAAQAPSTLADTIATATEFTIPTAAAFTLLGSTPAEVTTPGFTKDVKLDYFTEGKTLRPNIAFQFQPVWLFGFRNISLDEYRRVHPVVRALSRLSVSIGTVQDNDSVSRLAYAGRITFEKDPMMDRAYTDGIAGINRALVEEADEASRAARMKKQGYRNSIRAMKGEQSRLRSPQDDARLAEIEVEIAKLESGIEDIDAELKGLNASLGEEGAARIDSFVQAYIERGWARPRMDLGFGAVNRYTSGASITDLGLAESGYGVWVNPSAGIRVGPERSRRPLKILFTGLFRYTRVDEGGEMFYGGNLRAGSAGLNLFVEYTNLHQDAFATRAIGYGGAYRIGNKKLLQFGIRTSYDEDFRFRNLRPVVSFDWKLGRDALRDLRR